MKENIFTFFSLAYFTQYDLKLYPFSQKITGLYPSLWLNKTSLHTLPCSLYPSIYGCRNDLAITNGAAVDGEVQVPARCADLELYRHRCSRVQRTTR